MDLVRLQNMAAEATSVMADLLESREKRAALEGASLEVKIIGLPSEKERVRFNLAILNKEDQLPIMNVIRGRLMLEEQGYIRRLNQLGVTVPE